MSHRWKLPKISIACYQYGPECRPLITGCIKKQQNHLRRFFLSYMPASIPSGPKCSLTSFPQCWHLISRTVHSVSVPSSSKMRRLHLGLGHLITSICHRLLYFANIKRKSVKYKSFYWSSFSFVSDLCNVLNLQISSLRIRIEPFLQISDISSDLSAHPIIFFFTGRQLLKPILH